MAKTIIAKNQTESDKTLNDLGALVIPASSQLDLGVRFPFEILTASDDLETEINNDNILINNGIQDLNKTDSISYLSYGTELEPYNPPNYTFMLQANIIYTTFLNHSEEIFAETELKNGFADFFKGINNVSLQNQVIFDGASTHLEISNNTTSQLDNFDTISNWTAESGVTLTLETTTKYEGTGSGKMTIANSVGENKWKYIEYDMTTGQNWNSYDSISLWVYGQRNGEKIRFKLIDTDSNAATTCDFLLSSGWQQIYLDISEITRTSIQKIRIEVQKNNPSGDVTVYVDDMVLQGGDITYYSTGYLESNTITTPADVKEIFFSDLAFTSDNNSYVIKISLDGGTNWHQLDFDEGEKNKFMIVSNWAESFTNLKNIKVRIELSTSDTSESPLFDDYLIMWKLDV